MMTYFHRSIFFPVNQDFLIKKEKINIINGGVIDAPEDCVNKPVKIVQTIKDLSF